jgi:hypothetical protein
MHLIGVLLFFTACAIGPRIDTSIGMNPPAWYAMNIGANDLLNPTTSATRLAIYLDELTAAGYAKEIRIIFTPDWGPQIYRDWFPVIRAKGFKVLVILGQEKRDSALIPEASKAWARSILPVVKSDLIGVQIVNEAWFGFTPVEYVAWHRIMAPIIRAAAPGVPIVVGDPPPIPSRLDWWEAVVHGGIDFDIVSLHVTDADKESNLLPFVQRLSRLHGPIMRYWITEGDWGQFPWLMGHGLNVEKDFIYSWNSNDGHARRPSGPLP